MQPSLIIFDCDGVLVDSETVALRVLNRMLQPLGLALSPDAFRPLSGSPPPELGPGIARILGRSLPEGFITSLDANIDRAFETELRPMPGVADLLEIIAGAGIPYCAASNSTRAELRFKLDRTRLLGYFRDRLFSAHDTPRFKPYPDVYLQAAARLGVAPDRCAVIEDSSSGVRAGVAAGMTVFGFCPNRQGAELAQLGALVFQSMSELPELLEIGGYHDLNYFT